MADAVALLMDSPTEDIFAMLARCKATPAAPEPLKTAPADWQRAVIERYPQIGVAGSKENLAFTKACKENPDTPPMMIADTLDAEFWEPMVGKIQAFDMSKLSPGDRARFEIESMRASWADE